MASNNFWMKLWFDILRDPKMGLLPDRLWRRVIELFLLAGQNGESGILPEVEVIAWQLKKSPKTIKDDLEKIAETGIIERKEDGTWFVTNFKKRNAPIDNVKRVKDFRTRERYENSNADVTERYEKCNEALQLRYQEEQKNRGTEETELKIKSAADFSEKNADLYVQFQRVGKVTEGVKSDIDGAVDRYSRDWVRDAISEAIEYNAASFSYVEKILKSWKINGRNGKTPKSSSSLLEAFRKIDTQQKEVF